jgi:glycerophosphoryl diester phosphodiesterase
LKSFDPAVMAHLQENRARFGLDETLLGMVAQASYDDPAAEWAHLPVLEKAALAQFLHFEATRPEFLSYGLRDLPHAVPLRCRDELGLPVITWTVRDKAQAELARQWADQIIFEGWRPA